MLFNSLPFVVFFLSVLAMTRTLPRRVHGPLLLMSSLVFYALWYPPYLLLLVATILVNFVLMGAMVKSSRPKLFLSLSVIYTLSQLAYFKYATFLWVSILRFAIGDLGEEPPAFDVVLPLGISFYSFQIIALTVDVYRGRTAPVRDLGRYALFVCFFPQLIAGPIVRGRQLLPQIERGGVTGSERTRRGIWLIATGLVKKVIIGDSLLAPFVNAVFDSPGLGSAPIHLVGLYSFAFQIYFDFSGYTDMARGLGFLLGFELPRNFAEPYLSRNPAEFWRRWHITLSEWLRDYLYIPLGGNRSGRARTVVNLMLTMLLGGLWHGASWNFVIWGGLHGMLLVAHRVCSRRRRRYDERFEGLDWLRAVLLFQVVCLIWIFFRAPTLDEACLYLTTVVTGDYTKGWPLFQLGIVVACWGLQAIERIARRHFIDWQTIAARAPWAPPLEGLVLGGMAAAVLVASRGEEFIYFQF